MQIDPAKVAMGEPIACFLTWTTYGTWLPGDERGWVERPGQFRLPHPAREAAARSLLREKPFELDAEQRRLVEETIAKHCTHRGWHLHVVNCRTKHVHVVASAGIVHPKTVRDQLKAWCTRRLKELQQERCSERSQALRVNWWTERGSARWINDEDSLAAVIRYVRECQ